MHRGYARTLAAPRVARVDCGDEKIISPAVRSSNARLQETATKKFFKMNFFFAEKNALLILLVEQLN
jgi:hypothetical protein